MEGSMTLGGRSFRPLLQSTIDHDFWTMSQIRAAGLDRLTMGLDETPEDFAHRMIGLIVQTKRIYALLGGLLIPVEMEDLQWTPETGEQTAAHLQTITDMDEKKLLMNEIATLVTSFFVDGLISLRTFRRSLEAGEARQKATGEPSDSASGLPSSGRSADTTPESTKTPGGGRSGRPSSPISRMFRGKR